MGSGNLEIYLSLSGGVYPERPEPDQIFVEIIFISGSKVIIGKQKTLEVTETFQLSVTKNTLSFSSEGLTQMKTIVLPIFSKIRTKKKTTCDHDLSKKTFVPKKPTAGRPEAALSGCSLQIHLPHLSQVPNPLSSVYE